MTQLSPQFQTDIFPTEFFPGAVTARPGVPAGPGVQEASHNAPEFAALLDMAGTIRDTPSFPAAFLPPESPSFSPIREPDRFYDSRPPDAARLSPADKPAESGAVSEKTEASPADDRAGTDDGSKIRREEAAAAFSGENTDFEGQVSFARTSSVEGSAAEGAAEAETAGHAGNTGGARERVRRDREKPGISGEDLEMIPGFEEGIFAGVEIDADQREVISGEPEEADEAAGARPALSVKPESARNGARNTERAESDGTIRSGVVLAASIEDAAEAAAPAENPGADLAGAETAGFAREGEGRSGEFSGAKAAATVETVPENVAAELAALPRQQKPPAPERAEAEKEGREEPGETRKGGRRKFNPELRDFRTTPKINGGNSENNGGRAPGDYVQNHGQEQEIIVDLKSQARGQAEVSYNRENRAQLSFRETLARELHENLNGDIVRHASVILKNGGEGLIRLSLRPEHLGNVKIRLEMSENKVVGRITVESGEALRAFEQELRSLEQDFRDSGFDGATLEMSVSSDGGRGGGYRENGEEAPFFSERLAAHSYDAASGAAGDTAAPIRFAGGAGRQVDMLA